MLKILLILFSTILIPFAFAESVTSHLTILGEGEILVEDEIVLEEDEVLDVSEKTISIDEEFTQTIDDVSVEITQQVTIIVDDDVATLKNIELDTVTVEIPTETKILGPTEWDNTILPPTEIPTTGTIPPGFDTPDNVIQVGSPDVILIFTQPVTIILEGVTGQTAYKLAGEFTWNLINECTGTYDSPNNPEYPKECSITNGIDTKIVTFHFTEFSEFKKTVEKTKQRSSSSSGGSHRTGVTTPSVGFNDTIKSSNALPNWLKQPVIWWTSGQITSTEFASVIGWLIDEDIIKIENKIKPEEQRTSLAPATKHLFSLWEKDILSESAILNIIEKYREYGIW